MRLSAFCGTRFQAEPETIGARAAPPYDQIDDGLRDRLHAHPHHFSHLTRPSSGAGGDPHQQAVDLYRAWQREEVFVTDPVPAVYPYEIDLEDGRKRLGICALVGLENEDSKIVRPHEATVAKTVAERLALLRRTRVDFEPILFIAEDGGGLNPLLEADIRSAPLIADHRDETGARHRLYQVTSPSHVDAYKDLLADKGGVIADGHHRYTVARRFANEVAPARESPAAMKLMVVTSIDSEGLSIEPIHRGLAASIDLERARHLVADSAVVQPADGPTLSQVAAEAVQPAFVVGPIDGRYETWSFDSERPAATLDSNLVGLAVGWLHRAVAPALDLGPIADTDGTVVYRSDPERLYSEIASGELSTGFWLPPMSNELFATATANGEVLPPKSTRFVPKLVSGLVWASHDCKLG